MLDYRQFVNEFDYDGEHIIFVSATYHKDDKRQKLLCVKVMLKALYKKYTASKMLNYKPYEKSVVK